MQRLAWALLLTLATPLTTLAQGSRADYERADSLRSRATGTIFRNRVEPHWFADGKGFWYRLALRGGATEFVTVDASKPDRTPAFDHAKLAEAFTQSLGRAVTAEHLPVERIEPGPSGSLLLNADGKAWQYDPAKASLTKIDALPALPAGLPPPQRRFAGRQGRGEQSPDGKWSAFVKDHNIHLREKSTGKEFALGAKGTQELGDEPGVYWSPDSKHFVAFRVAKAQEHPVSFVQSSPRDRVQPRVLTHNYLKPGDRIEIRKPRLYSVTEKKEVPVSDGLFSNPWSIQDLRWEADSTRFTFLYNQRGHQSLRVITVNAATGETRALIDEVTTTFIDYSQKSYFQRIDPSHELIWMSERSGWNHLYLIDAETGAVKNPITKGNWVVRSVHSINPEKRTLILGINGFHPGEDPYHVHFARVNFDGSGFTLLTEGDGTHEIQFSPNGKYLIDTYSRVDLAPINCLRDAETGKLLAPLEQSDIKDYQAKGLKFPERFVAKGRDGVTDIHGVIYRPLNHDPKRKYPVIEQIYAGPHGAHVPKSFSPVSAPQSMAELGFILVQIDGMGTNWRSRAFHDVCWKNLADAGFPDRIAWLKAAAQHEPSMDLGRVGIYGGSAGGQNALGAVLFHPEFYKAAAADCGCHDNRMDKIWWNEAWMGWPIGPHYAEQSNVTNAHRLQGKLLLTVGETDHNVDPASTMQVVNALIRADKDFELIVVPGADHGAGESPYGRRRRRDFFVRSLLGVEPRHE